MASMTDYLENQLVDHVLRNRSFTMPTSLWIALYTAAPSDAGGGTEVSGGNYARVEVGAAFDDWESTQGTSADEDSTGTGGATENVSQLTFPTPSANWGSVTHFAILDASTGGNMLFHGALTTPKTVNNGDPAPFFAAGAIDITLA